MVTQSMLLIHSKKNRRNVLDAKFLKVLYIVLIALMWGLSAFFDKLALTKLGNAGAIILLTPTIPSLLIFVALLILSAKLQLSKTGIIFVGASWLLTSAGAALYYLLLTSMGVGVATTVVMVLYPIIALVLGALFLGEVLTIIQIVGVLISLIGAYLVLR